MPALAAIRREVPPILRLAVPIVAGLAASTLIGVTDALMLAPLGALPLAAAGLTNAVLVIIISGIYGTLATVSVRVGAAFGAREGRRIPFILVNSLALGVLTGAGGVAVMGLVWPLLPVLGQPAEVLEAMPAYYAAMAAWILPFSVLLALKSALEAVGRAWTGTAFAFLGVVLNVPLNYALIWGIGPFPELGLLGAGVASFVAEALALGAAFLWLLRARGARRLRLPRPLDGREIWAALREGLPLGLLYVAESGAGAVATVLIGLFGTMALAANQVAMSIEAVFYMLPLGIAGAVAIRVAEARGAGETERIRAIAWSSVAVALTWLVPAALILGLGGGAIARAVTGEEEVAGLAGVILMVIAPMLIADSLQSTMLGALRGLSDTGVPAAVSMVAFWVVALPLGWALATWGGMGAPGIWAGFVAGLFLAAGLLVMRFRSRLGLLAAGGGL